jgi:acyl-CoA synthetase (NDP forming)
MMRKKNILVYSTPERAAMALSKLYEYQRYLDKTVGNRSRPVVTSPLRKNRITGRN